MDLRIGQRVRVKSRNPEYIRVGSTGKILEISGPHDYSREDAEYPPFSLQIGVEWDRPVGEIHETSSREDLGHELTGDDGCKPRHGWYVPDFCLERINTFDAAWAELDQQGD